LSATNTNGTRVGSDRLRLLIERAAAGKPLFPDADAPAEPELNGDPAEPRAPRPKCHDRDSHDGCDTRAGEVAWLRETADLPAMHADIVQALQEAGREVGPKELARRAGYKYSSYFRAALRALQGRRVIRRSLDGYVLLTLDPWPAPSGGQD